MNDPRYDKPEESRPLAFRCPNCGDIRDEEKIRVVEHPNNLRHYETIQCTCPACTVNLAKKNGTIWDYLVNEFQSVINNLNKQTI